MNHHWDKDGLSPDPENQWGFIYLLWDKDLAVGYIGSKQYWRKKQKVPG